jgi:hypothetical protein
MQQVLQQERTKMPVLRRRPPTLRCKKTRFSEQGIKAERRPGLLEQSAAKLLQLQGFKPLWGEPMRKMRVGTEEIFTDSE